VARPVTRWSVVLGLSVQVGFGGAARASADEPRPADSAGASPVEQQRPAGADALIARGIQLRKAGDDRAALAAFEQAYAASGSAQALAQMALAEQALGRWVAALLHLERALAVRGDRWIDGHRSTLEAAREEIASRLGQLEVSCNVPGALVEIDGEPIGQTPLSRAQPVVAGLSVVKVSVLMYSSLGLGAAGLALGVTGYVVREINISEYNDDSKCRVQPGIWRSEECPDQYDAYRRGQTLAIVGFATAAVFGGVGLYLWLDRPEERTRQALGCSMSLGGVRCAGRF
jgi:tetratricopeptide (TPR) repeat protein